MVTTIEGFDIRSHVEKLSPAKGKNRYHCPVCDGQNLTVCDKTGKYKCWNGCESKDIREAIAPWKGRSPQNDAWLEASRSVRASPKPKRPTPAVIPEGCPTLALLPEQPQLPQRIKGNDPRHGLVTTIQFPYSDTQWVQRKEWVDESKPKGRSKSILPYHVNGEGEVVCKKGEDYWLPYRMDEVEAFGAGNWVLLVEGESCVEVSRSIGVVSFTLQGASWTSEDLYAAFLQCKAANVAGVVMFPDNDEVGISKTKKAYEAAAKAGVPFVTLTPHDVWADIPAAGDIADWIKWGRKEVNMNRDEFIKKLEEQLNVSVEGAREPARQEKSLAASSPVTDPKERLRLDVKALVKETDPISYEVTLADIQARYRLNHKAMERIIRSVNDLSKEAELVDMGLDELFDLPTDNIEYVIPGMLPVGEAALLIANPKTGKSLVAYDAAFAVATGEDTFLGEQCKQGKVLIVQCDESVGTAKGRLRKRGLRHEDTPNVRFIHKFRITQLAALEAKLETFRPTLVVIDSLRKINAGREVSENSAEFADNIYQLKELCSQYNAALILIHHSNKNSEAVGVEKVRGSSAIAGATWGIWELNQIPIPDPNNKKKLIIDPKDPTRIFSVIARDVEGQRLCIELDPENNHWINRGEPGVSEEDAREQKSHSTKVIELLSKVAPVGLEAREINEQLALGRGIYSVLNRLLGQKIIGSRPSTKDRRRTVYFCSTGTRDDQEAPTLNCGNPPPPTLPDPNVIDYSESHTPPNVQSSITVDHKSITFDHTPPVDEEAKKASNVEPVDDTEYSITSPHDGGGRVVKPDVIEIFGDDESTQTGTNPFDPYSPPDNVWFEGSYEVFDQFGQLIGDYDDTEETPLESLKRLMSGVTSWEELEALFQEVEGTFSEFWDICSDAQRVALNQLRQDAGLEPIPVIDDAVEDASETLTETLEDDVEGASQTLTETLGGELIDLSEEASLPQKQVPVWMVSDSHYLNDLPETPLGNLIRVLDRVESSEEFNAAVEGLGVELVDEAIAMQNTHHKRQQLRKWLGEVSDA